MGHWNYRVVKVVEEGVPYFGVYEVYYNDIGIPDGRTKNPATFECGYDEGSNTIVDMLQRALKNALKKPVLNDSIFDGG